MKCASRSTRREQAAPAPAVSLFGRMTSWLIALVCTMPMLLSFKAMDPSVTIRYIFLSFFVTIFIVYFYLVRSPRPVLPTRPLARLFLGLFLALCVWNLLTIFGAVNAQEGYYVTARLFLNLILVVLVMVAARDEEDRLPDLFRVLVLVSIVQSLIGILQYYQVAFTTLPPQQDFPFGLMSNRNLFASAQVLLLPWCALAFITSRTAWRIAAGAALLLGIVSIVLAQTRSAWVATLLAALVIQVFVWLYRRQLRPDFIRGWWRGSAAGLVGLFVVIAVVVARDKELFTSVKERALSLVGRESATSAAAATKGERLIVWQQCLEMLRDHPLLGVGPGNWRIIIPNYGSEGLVNAYGERVRIRPHNVYLQVADETGVPGLLLYLGLWVTITVTALSVIVTAQTPERRLIGIVLLAGLACYAIDSLFSFPNERLEHSLYLALMCGVLLGVYENLAPESPGQRAGLSRLWFLLPLVLAIGNTSLAVARYNFEVHMNLAGAYKKKGRWDRVLLESARARSRLVNLNPIGDPVEIHSGEALMNLDRLEDALAANKVGLRYHPNSARLYNNLGTVYTKMRRFDDAIACYQRALEFTPKWPVPLMNLAVNYYNVGNFSRSVATFEQIDLEGDELMTQIYESARQKAAEGE